MSNNIFDYNIRNGLSVYQLDVIKLMIEDSEFFAVNIETIDQNHMSDWVLRSLIGMMKDVWCKEGIQLSYDGLLSRCFNYFRNELEQQEAEEYINTMKKKQLSPERIIEVKNNFKYWDLFYEIVKLSNYLNDTLHSDGIKTLDSLEKIANKVHDSDTIIRNIQNNRIGSGDENNWE